MNEFETRFHVGETRVRSEDDKNMLVGYGAVFDSLSENLGGFREKIAFGAFDNVMNDDVRGVFNHDPSMVLGRTKSGTMKISIDKIGLRYEIELADTQVSRDITIAVARGDIDGSSFKFQVGSDTWEEDEDGRVIRTITEVSRLLDVGPVTFPAYPNTATAQRSLGEYKETANKCCKPSISSLKLKLNNISL